LIPDNRGRRVIPFEHFINNDLEYLQGDYGHIKWIEDLVPLAMWIQEPINYDRHALWGVSHWGRKRQQFYGFAVNRESALDDDCMKETSGCYKGPYDSSYAAPIFTEVEHKNQKRSNEMYYPRFTKVIIDYFMTRKSFISRRNRINWHYVRDDVLTEAEQLKIALKRSRQETHISQQRGSGTYEGNGSRPGVPDVPSDDSEEELSWNSVHDEEGDEQTKGREESEGDKTDESDNDNDDDDNDETVKAGSESDKDDDDNDDEEEHAKNDDEDTEFGSEDESNDEEDQELRLSEEARIEEEEEADELYRDPDGPQESSSVSSFLTSMLNPASDVGVESIFTTASSPIVSLQTPTPIMTPSTIATITTSGDAPIPPTTIPSIILENLPTFNSAFYFDERLMSLEITFSEYRQTNLFVDAVSAIPGIVHQYMTQQMTEAVREAVQIMTDRLQDLLQQENDEFLRNIDENIKKIIKGQVKSQVKEQVLRILPRIEESVNSTLEAEILTRSSHSSKTSYAIAADLSEMELKKILIEKME
nr:hypothetical protein [Tanacetum cinerariifolium]